MLSSGGFTAATGSGSSANAASAKWDELRKEARKLEADLDLRLVAYSKLGSSISVHSSNASSSVFAPRDGESGGDVEEARPLLDEQSRKCRDLEDDIDDMIQRLFRINESMQNIVHNSPQLSSALYTHTLQRHREILHDYTQEFKKYKASITASREHAELLSSVRRDISSFKSGSPANLRGESLLRERTAIYDSDRMASDALSAAVASRDSLIHQRSYLSGINRRLGDLRSRFPALDTLMTRISRKKRRDMIVVSLLIAVCIAFTIFYMTR